MRRGRRYYYLFNIINYYSGILYIAIGAQLLVILLGHSHFNQLQPNHINNGFSPTEIIQIDQAAFC